MVDMEATQMKTALAVIVLALLSAVAPMQASQGPLNPEPVPPTTAPGAPTPTPLPPFPHPHTL